MPNKTIYVKDSDLSLLEQAQEQLGDSVSSILKKKRDLPQFIDSECAEAQAHAERALKSLRAGEIRSTTAFFWAANTYYERGQRDAKEISDLNEKIAGMIGQAINHP